MDSSPIASEPSSFSSEDTRRIAIEIIPSTGEDQRSTPATSPADSMYRGPTGKSNSGGRSATIPNTATNASITVDDLTHMDTIINKTRVSSSSTNNSSALSVTPEGICVMHLPPNLGHESLIIRHYGCGHVLLPQKRPPLYCGRMPVEETPPPERCFVCAAEEASRQIDTIDAEYRARIDSVEQRISLATQYLWTVRNDYVVKGRDEAYREQDNLRAEMNRQMQDIREEWMKGWAF